MMAKLAYIASLLIVWAALPTPPSLARDVGPLDLRDADWKAGEVRALNVTWEVYWDQILQPEELTRGAGQRTHVVEQTELNRLQTIPDAAGNKTIGYLTLRARFQVNPQSGPLALFLKRSNSAYDLFVNGKPALSFGTVGTTEERSRPKWGTAILPLEPGVSEYELVFQMSNFHTAGAGKFGGIDIGSLRHIQTQVYQTMLIDGVLLGAIVVMGFYHFALFLIRRREPAALFFGLFCLMIAGRTLSLSEGLLLFLQAHTGGMTVVYGSRLEYCSWLIAVPLFHFFLRHLFPKELPQWTDRFAVGFFGSSTVFVLLTPPFVYQEFLSFFQITTLFLAAIALYSLFLAAIRGQEGARLFLFGFFGIFVSVINDILFTHALIDTFHSASLGLFVFILVQSIVLSKRFAKAFEQVQIAESEIRALNEDLERKVLDRTETIRRILDNVKSGFLMIDSDLRIMEGFTRSCYQLLGSELNPGRNFIDLLDLVERDRMRLDLALRQVFEDLMPEDVTLGQIPYRFEKGGKGLSLQGSVVRTAPNKPPVALLMTIADVTQLVRAEAEASHNRALLKIISEKMSFRAFIRDSLQSLTSCLEMVKKRDYQDVPLILHTLKGNFALYGLDTIAALVHNTEEEKQPGEAAIQNIISSIESFLQQHRSFLGYDAFQVDAPIYEVSAVVIDQLEQDLARTNLNRYQAQTLRNWIEAVRMVPIRELLGPIESNVERVAYALGKTVRFTLEGAELRVDPERMRNPLKNLVHAITNCIDHGIEYPEDRGEKDEAGHVFIRFKYDDMMNLCIEIGDDGRGLDTELIKHKAVEAGLVSRENIEQWTVPQVHKLIFHQGFTTKNNVSEFSGRGVGIAALEMSVTSLGGQLHLESELHKGTRMQITIPTEQTIQLLSGIA